MSHVMIKAFDFANTKTIDLVAEVDKAGNILKIYDYNGNELKINFLRDEVYYKKTWWHSQKKQK